MRDIWFRGKSIDAGCDADCDEFYYGDLMHDGGESYCMYLPDDGSDTAIDIDTVGQFTGMYYNAPRNLDKKNDENKLG